MGGKRPLLPSPADTHGYTTEYSNLMQKNLTGPLLGVLNMICEDFCLQPKI